jgi:integrase/recombinase XerD
MPLEETEWTRRYADMLRARGCAARTIASYQYALTGFARFVAPRSVAETTVDDIVEYQMHIVGAGRAAATVRVSTYALRGFFRDVLQRKDWDYARLPRQRRPKHLPEVLSVEEVQAILDHAPTPKYRAIFMTCYGAGLRTDETIHLEPRHVDAKRMALRVERGKGSKDRPVVLSPRLLHELRQCWKRYRPKRYLFEGKHPGRPVDPSSVQRAFQIARQRAGVIKRATPYSLRHAFATHLVEAGTNLRVVQTLLGHQSLSTTAVYTHLAQTWLAQVTSPLDRLPSSTQ